MATYDYASPQGSEKIDIASSPRDDVEENSKTEVIDDNGEVFQQAEYRALGW